MPRLTPLTSETAPPEGRDGLRGPVTVATRIMAYWPPLLTGVAAMTTALETDRRVPESLLRLAKLRTAQLVGCPF